MKKQNRSPNQVFNPSKQKKSNSNLKPCAVSVPFKPRFIVKDTSAISYQDMPINPHSQPTHSYSHLGVPVISYTGYQDRQEQHPLSSDFIGNNSPMYSCVQTRSNSFRRNWKEQYEAVSRQMKSRTKKFNQIIDLCRNILTDVSQCTQEGCSARDSESQCLCMCNHRMEYVNEKVEMLISTFDLFRQEGQ